MSRTGRRDSIIRALVLHCNRGTLRGWQFHEGREKQWVVDVPDLGWVGLDTNAAEAMVVGIAAEHRRAMKAAEEVKP